jgi:hypothetical protein
MSRNGEAITSDTSIKNIPVMSTLFIGAVAAAGMYYLFKMFKKESEYVISLYQPEETRNIEDSNNLPQ